MFQMYVTYLMISSFLSIYTEAKPLKYDNNHKVTESYVTERFLQPPTSSMPSFNYQEENKKIKSHKLKNTPSISSVDTDISYPTLRFNFDDISLPSFENFNANYLFGNNGILYSVLSALQFPNWGSENIIANPKNIYDNYMITSNFNFEPADPSNFQISSSITDDFSTRSLFSPDQTPAPLNNLISESSFYNPLMYKLSDTSGVPPSKFYAPNFITNPLISRYGYTNPDIPNIISDFT